MPLTAPSRWTKLFYGIGAVAFGVKDNGFQFFLLLYYNQVLGLPEQRVGLGIMVALVIDAIVDPLIGHLSDHLHSRWGRRHPFMYLAALPIAVAYALLWRPPAGLAPQALFAYFVALAVLVRILIALYEIPSASLAAELTDEYDERTSLLGSRFFFGWWGGLVMAVLAYAVFLQPDAAHPVGVLNAAGYRRYGMASAVIMAAAMLASALGTHAHIPHLKPPPPRPRSVGAGARELVETLSNRSFLALFVAGIFAGVAAGLMGALTIYLNTYFWELTSSQISVLVLSNFVSAAIALGLARPLSRRFGKKPAAIVVSLVALTLGAAPVLLRLAGAFPPNGSPILLPTLLVLNATTVTLLITSSILTSSMLADVVEDSEVATGRRSEGLFFAANSFIQKAVSGIGVFASTVLLTAIHFPRDAKPGAVDPTVVRRLGIAYAPTLFVLYLIAIAVLSAYRINRARHEANLARLARRAAS